MENFVKTVNGYKPFTLFVKHSILDIWQGSEYKSVICYSMLGKIEDASKTDLVAMQIYSFWNSNNYHTSITLSKEIMIET